MVGRKGRNLWSGTRQLRNEFLRGQEQDGQSRDRWLEECRLLMRAEPAGPIFKFPQPLGKFAPNLCPVEIVCVCVWSLSEIRDQAGGKKDEEIME